MLLSRPLQIYQAVAAKNYKNLKLLLNKATFNDLNSKYLTDRPLDLAASSGDEVSVELLLAHGAIPDYNKPKHVWSDCTLGRAIRSGNEKVIRLLISRGCNPDHKLTYEADYQPTILNAIPYNYWYEIINLNDLSIFQLMLDCMVRKIDDDEWDQMMLFIACGLGSCEIVNYLLDQGVSIESTDEKGWTSLFFAVANSRISVFELLIARGANCDHKNFENDSLLHIAIQRDRNYLVQRQIIQWLIGYGKNINAVNNKGFTPINLAATAIGFHSDTFRQLLRLSDVDLNKPDNEGITVLHHVVTFGRSSDFLKYVLCKPNININPRDIKGRTPLQYIKDYCLKNLSILLEFGADTKDLLRFDKYMIEEQFLNILGQYALKRKIAGLKNDSNIDTLLGQRCEFLTRHYANLASRYEEEIQRMKKTILCGKLTFYDFLRAEKRTCINIAKKSEVQETLLMSIKDLNIEAYKHEFEQYANMLAKNCVIGMQPLTRIESEAVKHAERNLDIIFNHKMPSLITYYIKNLIDIDDMVTLEKIVKL